MKGFNILKCARNSTFFHFVKVNYTVSLLYYKDTLHKRVIKNESINLELGENGTINESINPELGVNGTINESINPKTGENESINGTINPELGKNGTINESINPKTGENGTINGTINPEIGENGTINGTINPETGENGTINESINPELGGNGTINHETGENESINGTINENHMLMLSMILHNPTITIKMMCEKTGLSKTTIHRYIKELKELGYLERIGSRKNGTWIVCCSGLEKTNKE